MRETRIIMGMPIIVEIVDAQQDFFKKIFDYFIHVDEKFSTYKSDSEITAINAGRITPADCSDEMKEIFLLSEETKKQTGGYFDIVNRKGKYDPSGIVKGWAIYNASKILWDLEVKDFYIDAGGDIQTSGHNERGEPWRIGIADPFEHTYSLEAKSKSIKVLSLSGQGVATSGISVRGQHIYNPHKKTLEIVDIASLTVVGPNIYEADRFATAAFAMGAKGIQFIESLRDIGLEGYMVSADGIATMTSGFEKYSLSV